MPQDVVSSGFFELPAEKGALRTRPDQTHFTAEDVENLRQFVEARLADEAADFGDATVIARSPGWTIRFGILVHRAELQDFEGLTSQAGALLAEQNRRTRLKPDRRSYQSHDRKRHDQRDKRDDDIHGTLCRQQKCRLAEAVRKHQPTRRKILKRDPSSYALVDRMRIFDSSAPKFELQQLAHRQLPAPFFQGDDYP